MKERNILIQGFLVLYIILASALNSPAQTDQILTQLQERLKQYQIQSKNLRYELNNLNDSINSIENQMRNRSLQRREPGSIIDTTTTRVEGNLRDSPTYSGTVVSTVPPNSNVYIIEYAGDSYWKVVFQGKVGFMNEILINKTTKMPIWIKKYEVDQVNLKKSKQNAQIVLLNDSKSKIQEEYRIELTKLFGHSAADKILFKIIWIGMTKEMARKSIGDPIKINKRNDKSNSIEHWIYDKKSLIFEDELLASWQDF